MSCHAILCHDTVQVMICRGCYAAHALGAIEYELSNMGNISHVGLWGILWASTRGI